MTVSSALRRRILYSSLCILYLGTSAASVRADGRPGRWQVSPSTLISGSSTRIELQYRNERHLPAGTRHRILIEPLSVKSVFHCPPSEDIELTLLDGEIPNVELHPSPVHGVGFRQVELEFPVGLKPGDSFSLVIGNRLPDGRIVGLVNPVPVRNLRFETYTLLPAAQQGEQPRRLDWQLEGWVDGLPKVDIIPGPAAHVRAFVPSLVQAGTPFALRLSIVDAFDSPATPAFVGDISLDADDGITGVPSRLTMRSKDECAARVDGVRIDRPGVYRIRARMPHVDRVFESNPIVVRDKPITPLYWGNIHNHSWYSECWGDDLATTYRLSRDAAGMDFVAISDHRAMVPRDGRGVSRLLRWRLGTRPDSLESWRDTVDKANAFNRKDFVTLIGYEWSSMDAGHYNIYFTDDDLANVSRYFTNRYIDYGFALRDLLHETDALFIPHVHADLFPYLCLDDQAHTSAGPLTPAVEVYSDWGDAFFPHGDFAAHTRYGGLRHPDAKSYLWALEHGYRIAAIGDSDCHAGIPGRRVAGGIAPNHDHPQGLTAARTDDFTRSGIMQAYRDMHVYGTTGARIFLDARIGNSQMGDTHLTDAPFSLMAEIAGTAPIHRVMLYDGLTQLDERSLDGDRDGQIVFDGLTPTDESRPYVVAVVQADGHRAYGTPIWVRRASVPDLMWTRDAAGRMCLTNTGTAPARDVDIVISHDEHPFAAADVPGHVPEHHDGVGLVWLRRRSDHKLTLHFRWHGAPISGQIALAGATVIDIEPNRDQFFGGKTSTDASGITHFTTGKPVLPERPQGISFLLRIPHDRPSVARLTLDRSTDVYIGHEKTVGREFTIALNGRTSDDSLDTDTIARLDPGESWYPQEDSPGAYHAADPNNQIAEINESNNLYHATGD